MLMTFSSSGISRRFILIPLVLASVLALLAGCSSSTPAKQTGASSSSTQGPWSYTDAVGAKIKVDHQPKHIAAFADQALTLLSYGVKPVAIFGRVNVKTDDRFAKYDLSGISIVGNSYGEIDMEKLAAARPDLIITGIYPTDRKGTLDTKQPFYGFNDMTEQGQATALAPIATVKIGGTGLSAIEANVKLAEALGASPAVVSSQRKAFDKAAAHLKAVSQAHSNIEVTQLYADADGLALVKPDDEPVTQLYKTYGVKLTDLHPNGDYYWDKYSWENAGKMMTGDVVLANNQGYGIADLKKQPSFANDPALKANQAYSWEDAALNYSAQTAQMNRLADIIAKAKDVAK